MLDRIGFQIVLLLTGFFLDFIGLQLMCVLYGGLTILITIIFYLKNNQLRTVNQEN
jgi:MFS transporter, DHA3 family, macrolide efflux protein